MLKGWGLRPETFSSPISAAMARHRPHGTCGGEPILAWHVLRKKGAIVYFYTRKALADAMKLMYERGLVSAFAGNISVRLQDGMAITPSGVHRHLLDVDDIVVVDWEGRRKWGKRKPSSEWRMHAAIYRARKDVYSVVHAHPRAVVALSELGFSPRGLAETKLFFGDNIPLVEKLPPGSEKLAEATSEALRSGGKAAVLASHGAVTLGRDVWEAEGLMEVLEEAAEILLFSLAPSAAQGLYRRKNMFYRLDYL